MENRELHPNLQAALQLVEGIFQMLGSRYEVILHDLSHVESSIVALAGDVTHRKIGGPVTNYLLQLLQKYGDSAPNSINYRNVTTDGRILRSSTIFIRDENGHIVGSLCINQDLTDYIVHTPYENLDLVPSSTLMSSIEYELFTKWQREFILRKCLQKIKDSEVYDYILIDAPPTLGGWVMNILCASDKVIIPVEASPWGMFGLANMFEFLNEVKQISPELEVAGIAVTKVDTRKNYFKQTMETLHELESIYVFEHVIRVDSSVEWSQDNSVPVVEYKKSSRSAKEYTELAEEVMNRVSR